MYIITCTTQSVDDYIIKHSINLDELKEVVKTRVKEIVDFMPEDVTKTFSFDYNHQLVTIDFIKKEFCEVLISEISKRIGGSTQFRIYESSNISSKREPSVNKFDELIRKRNNKFLNKYSVLTDYDKVVFPWYELAEDRWFIEGDEDLVKHMGEENLHSIINETFYENKDFAIVEGRVGFNEEEDCRTCIRLLNEYINN